MIHPDTELRWVSDAIGYGVFATAFIPRGTVVWTLCHLDIFLTPEEVASLPPISRRVIDVYGYINFDGRYTVHWDNARMVNHSCDPAMLPINNFNEIAVRDIEPGDELTCDYGILNYPYDLACECRAKSCRGVISRGKGAIDYEEFDRIIRAAMPGLPLVPQPLAEAAIDPLAFRDSLLATEPLPMTAYFCATA